MRGSVEKDQANESVDFTPFRGYRDFLSIASQDYYRCKERLCYLSYSQDNLFIYLLVRAVYWFSPAFVRQNMSSALDQLPTPPTIRPLKVIGLGASR